MHIKNKRGQSTVEYVLLVTAVVAVIIAFVAGSGNPFQAKLNSTLGTATDGMENMAGKLDASHETPASNATSNPEKLNVLNFAN